MPIVAALLFLFDNLVRLLDALIVLAGWIVIITAVLSWLIAFDVINLRNPTMYRIVKMLDQIVDPMLRPIRRLVPNLGGIDISPIILLLLLQVLRFLLGALRIAVDGSLVPMAGTITTT